MNVKEYLSRYHETKVKIEELEQIVAEYIRLANSIPGINFDQIRVDGTKSLAAPFTKWIHKALEKELQIADLKKQLQQVKCEIISVIDKLGDTEHKKLLIYRYIDWESWNVIANKMYISLSTLKRWHKIALQSILFE